MATIAAAIKKAGACPGIQIAHAGRKASANRPWEGDDHLAEDDPQGWQTLSPSAVAFGANLPKVPKAMTLEDIERVKADFVAAAKRARAAGFEWLELHFAHGYLAQSFFPYMPINATISMVATWPGAADSCWKPCRRCVKSGRKICH